MRHYFTPTIQDPSKCSCSLRSRYRFQAFYLWHYPVWSTKFQLIVSLSTTELEYRVLTEASKDIIYLQWLLQELGELQVVPTPIFNDNQSCICLVSNLVLHAHMKHIAILDHFIREKINSKEITVNFVPTNKQIS